MAFRIFASPEDRGNGENHLILVKEANTDKLITKHRKAAKMIGDLLTEKKISDDQRLEHIFFSAGLDLKIISKNREIKKLKDENKKLKEKIKEDNKIYKDFLIEKFKLQGEIRALERTIDKMIEARK